MAVQETRQKPLALTQSIDFFRAGNLGLYQHSLAALEHAPIRFAFILAFMGAQTDTLQWRQISCSPFYLLRSIGSLEQFGTRLRSSYGRAWRIGDFGLYQHSLAALEHAPIRFAFILAFIGAQTDTLQWRQISCSPLYLLRSIGSLEQFGTRSRSSYERACWIGDFRFVFVFVFSCLYTKLQNNTVLLIQYCSYHLPLKTVPYCSYPTKTKINNSTTVPLYMTSTYNSKTAVQYHMTPIFNSTVSYIHRSVPKSHTFLTALRNTLAARDLYCTPGTSINCPDISTLYRRYIYIFMRHLQHQDIDGHLLRLYIIFMRGHLHHERHGIVFGEARAPQGQGLSALSVFVLFFAFSFSFHGRL